MPDESRTPEAVLQEMYETGQRWIDARVRARRHGHPGIDSPVGDNPPTFIEAEEEDRAAHDIHELRGRFQTLVRRFIASVDAP